MPEFWNSSGYRLLRSDARGRLLVTPEYLRSMLLRPELAPMPDSSPGEIALHEHLMRVPDAPVEPRRIEALEDPDAAHNFRVWLRFRDRLLAADCIEQAYMNLFRDGVDVPPVLVGQLTRVLVQHVLGQEPSPFEVRAAEMLHRTQKITVTDDRSIVAGDAETVEANAMATDFGHVSELVSGASALRRTVDLDVMNDDNADSYWSRDERHDLALRIEPGSAGLSALTRVLERWIDHFLGVRVSILARREIDDRAWVWHVGLDAEASALLNDLYNREDVGEARLGRLLSLFELRFSDAAEMRRAIAGRPVYLALAMDEHQRVRMKPQNLLLNLPLEDRH